jgi:hypothetical protein
LIYANRSVTLGSGYLTEGNDMIAYRPSATSTSTPKSPLDSAKETGQLKYKMVQHGYPINANNSGMTLLKVLALADSDVVYVPLSFLRHFEISGHGFTSAAAYNH